MKLEQIGESKEVVSNANLIATHKGKTENFMIPENHSILKTLLLAGRNPRYSCESGKCGKCACRLKKGEVMMKNNLTLTELEIKRGLILSCQSYPLTEEVEIVY